MFKPSRMQLAVLALSASAVPNLAWSQQQLERVEITGSSIKRIDAETALPVTVITRAEIERTGATNVQELLDRATYNNGGGRSLGESIGESSAPGQTGASLRNLGRERTLVLLNGRRLTAYPFSGLGVDLNSIPLSAIERIEVLRDGASAVYGSDAIGGVINFITRKDLQGGELQIGFDVPRSSGGGGVAQLAGGFGFGDLTKDKFNIFGTFSVQDYTVLKAADRDFAQTGNRPDLGIVKFSSNTFPANTFIASGPDAGKRVQAASKYPTCAPPDSFNYAGACRYDYTHYIDIYPESSRTSALLRGVFQIDADNQLFADYAYSNNKIILGLSQTPSTTTGVRSRYPYPFGGKYYPTAAVQAVSPGYTGDLAVSWRIVDGGQRRDQVIADTRRLLLGAEGTLAGWDYNAAFALSEAKASDNYISGYYSDKLLVAALKTGNVNPFGPNDATGLALLTGAEIRGSIRDSKTSNNGFDFRASREIFNAPAGPVGFAFGGELRRETYLDGYTELAASGDIVGGSGTAGAVEGSRNIRGIFTEVSVPLIKGLDLQAAVRNDAYTNGSGSSRDGAFKSADYSATSPKIALRFQPLKSVLLRASMGQGFRAPALDNLYSPASFTNTGGQYNDPFYNALKNCASPTADTNRCAAQLTVQNNSNPNLKPEKSKQTSLGLALEPLDDLNLTVDYFDIKITNGITALTGDSILQDWYARQTGGPNSATSASPFANRLIKDSDGYLSYVAGSLENLAEARVAGYDVTLKYKLRTSFGNFSPKWEATYLTKSTTTNTVTGDVGDNLGQYARGGPALKLKQVYSLEYETGPWTFFGRLYKQSGYRDYDDGSLAVVPYVDTYSLVDVNVSFKGIKNVTLSAGVRNLLDKKPPVSIQQDYFQVGFDPTYSDVKLRTMFFRGTYKF